MNAITQNTFKETYIECLTEAVTERPDLYAWPIANVSTVAHRMFKALDAGSFNYDSLAFRKLAKRLGIKPTLTDISAAWHANKTIAG